MMTTLDILHGRLHNHHIGGTPFEKPADVVQWLGAVQAQDYGAAKWALGLRTRGVSDADIDRAFAEGAILRTHVMRPTWHFVLPADIRWMLALTAPRIKAQVAYYDRKLELDDALYARSNTILAKALEGGNQLTRSEIASILQDAGIATDDLLRLGYIVGRAELDAVVCSGARRGKQFTYALLDERVPQAKTLERDEALAELARRYFTSHGPATLQDYIWWSGLSAADARVGLDMVKSGFIREDADAQTYWFAAYRPNPTDVDSTVHLLPNYDEYIVGYTERSALFDMQHTGKLDSRGNVLFNHTIVIDGQIVGTWKRTVSKRAVGIEPNPFIALTSTQSDALAAAAARYGDFLSLPAVLA